MSDPKQFSTGGAGDFAAMLAEYDRPAAIQLAPGDRVRAKVIHIGASSVFCSVSPTQEGFVDRGEVTNDKGQLTDHDQGSLLATRTTRKIDAGEFSQPIVG